MNERGTFAQLACLLLALGGAPLKGAPPEPGVVQVEAAAPADDGWAAVEDARGGTGWAQALAGVLALHPHGLLASRALFEQAALDDDLGAASALLRRASQEGADHAEGSTAALALARLDFAQGRPEEALADLERADGWPRPEAIQAEWLYWRAQSRLALKGFRQAREDLRRLLALHPDSPRAEAALAARADCDLHCGDLKLAREAWTSLAQAKGDFAAQALWGLADLDQRQGRRDEAGRLYRRLMDLYPASFEAQAAPARLQALARLPGTTPVKAAPAPRKRWWVQVGAYSRRASAQRQAQGLRRHRWRAVLEEHLVDGQRLYFVMVGPYADRARAAAGARALGAREKIDVRTVEE